MDKNILNLNNINPDLIDADIDTVKLPIPEECIDDTNEEARIKYGLDN